MLLLCSFKVELLLGTIVIETQYNDGWCLDQCHIEVSEIYVKSV